MKVLHYISILLLLLSLAACKDSRIDDLTEQRVLGDSLYIQLTLDLSNMSATRANPNGGEQGDGWEYGLPNENEIQDFSLFIFKGYDINGDEDAPVYLKRYFSPEDVETATITEHESVNGKEVLSYEFKIPIIKGEDADNILNNIPLLRQFHFMVAANVGDITEEITTLGQFRDYIPTQTFSPSTIIEDYERFVMSNESDAFYKSGAGTMKDPVRMHVSVERLAARIDFDKTNSVGISDDNKSLIYELKSSDNTTVLSKLYLDELQIINGSIQPSYLIKRVAKDINGTDLTYLGDETPTPNGIATNYVIDPYSALKTDANRTNTELNLLGTLFGETPTPRFSLDPTKDNQILGYVNENTFDRTCTFAEYTTGVQLKCRFVPKHNYYVGYNAATDILLTPEETAEDDTHTKPIPWTAVEESKLKGEFLSKISFVYIVTCYKSNLNIYIVIFKLKK